MGSVKDRLAAAVIEAAERSGELSPGQTVIEASSGNTGIGLAMVCAAKGYPLVVVMAESFSVERRRLMRFLGARVILTPAAEKGTGMAEKARELAERHGWFLCRQFENPANAEIHARTTAREILAAFDGRRLDAFVTGVGTGGTLNGVARVLKATRPEIEIVVAEPDNSPILASGIAQAVRPDGSPAASHPMFRPHLMQGWTPDFISKLTQQAIDAGRIDRIVGVNGAQALEATRDLARREGILCGLSGGATFAAARTVAETMPAGGAILFMVPDTGERYLSTPLFADIPEEMTEAELEIARSTDGYQIGGPSQPAPAAPRCASRRERGVAAFEAAIGDPAQPVVMFALEWCEFSWALRNFFQRASIPYRSVDLDSVELQQRRSRRRPARGAAPPHRPAHHPAGLRRRRACRRLHRNLRCLSGRLARSPARTERHRRASERPHRHRRPAAEMGAPEMIPLARAGCDQRFIGKGQMERAAGIEPARPAWKAGALPLHHAR